MADPSGNVPPYVASPSATMVEGAKRFLEAEAVTIKPMAMGSSYAVFGYDEIDRYFQYGRDIVWMAGLRGFVSKEDACQKGPISDIGNASSSESDTSGGTSEEEGTAR